MTTQMLNTLSINDLDTLIIALNRWRETEYERLQTADHGPLVEDEFFEGELAAEDICVTLMNIDEARSKLVSIVEATPHEGYFEYAVQTQALDL